MKRLHIHRFAFLGSIFISALLIASALLTPLSPVAAQTGNSNFDITKGLVSPENIGCDGFNCQLCHVVKAVDNVISFMFYLGTVVAVLLFVYAGAKLMMAGGDSGAMTAAKGILWNVIIGVVIMLCAYLVVDTVLKTVLSTDAQRYGPWNQVQCVTLPTRGGGGGNTTTSSGGGTPPPTTTSAQESCTRTAFGDGIRVNKGSCNGANFQSVAGGCTDVAGLPRQAIEGLVQFKNNCLNCGIITITGGTEGGHSTHGPGRPMVDISSNNANVISYIRSHKTAPESRYTNGDTVYTINNDQFVLEGNPPHIHIIFGTTDNTPYQCPS